MNRRLKRMLPIRACFSRVSSLQQYAAKVLLRKFRAEMTPPIPATSEPYLEEALPAIALCTGRAVEDCRSTASFTPVPGSECPSRPPLVP
ncbi:hypothetical protein E4U48_002730 [Claviceps purpurea]|nr:hypothetical protein E4U48_002730 [Claviceps purpurea]